jgi:hypothetical protein
MYKCRLDPTAGEYMMVHMYLHSATLQGILVQECKTLACTMLTYQSRNTADLLLDCCRTCALPDTLYHLLSP